MASILTNLRRVVVGGRQPKLMVAALNNSFYTYANEISHPLNRKPPNGTPQEAVQCIKSGDVVFCSGATATPITLINAMVEHGKASNLQDVTVCHMHTEGPAAYTEPGNDKIFRSNSFFMGGNVRKAVAEGRGDNCSIFLHEIPQLFYKKIVQPDVALIHVSPPDRHGFCSLGTSVDCVRAALLHSKKIVAQVNKQMPRTFGDAAIHSSHFDAMTEIDVPLPQHGGKGASDVEAKIGKLIAENLVHDGATLQMGIGSIPDAVLDALHNHKDLGIHSEMFANGVVDLVKAGAVTNRMKKMHQGRIVGSFLIGNQALYDFVNDNPFIEMYAIDYVNNTSVIKLQPRMTAINSCIEVDLTGQVCSDSIGTRFFSCFGGQVDFIRGAAEGVDGKGVPIIAMPSVTNKGESKIVPVLKPGAGVVTSRAHVHYVVTEHGIASLFGKNMRQRAYELIQIAHPDHRQALEKQAFDRHRRPHHFSESSSSYSTAKTKKAWSSRTQLSERLSVRPKKHIFLPTALARVLAAGGTDNTRLMLNSGTAQTIILKSLVDRLQLKTTKKEGKEFCSINLQSYHDVATKIQIHGMVRQQLNTPLPERVVESEFKEIYNHIPDLADPNFYNPSSVEILLANDQMSKVLRAGLIQTSSNMPIAQSTIFGWTISGTCQI